MSFGNIQPLSTWHHAPSSPYLCNGSAMAAAPVRVAATSSASAGPIRFMRQAYVSNVTAVWMGRAPKKKGRGGAPALSFTSWSDRLRRGDARHRAGFVVIGDGVTLHVVSFVDRVVVEATALHRLALRVDAVLVAAGVRGHVIAVHRE